MMNEIKQEFEAMLPQMVEHRRYLHRHPELSFHEIRTSRWIADRLREYGIEVRERVGGNGLTADIGQPEGPCAALRADMDALPIQDEKQADYASEVPGVMHACGHDAHTSALLAVARYLQKHRGEWPGRVRLIFQHAEEMTPGGAQSMIEAGALDGVDAVYGVHLWTPFPTGHVYGLEGPMWAAADEFQIEVTGKGGHGGMPHQTVDSIVTAAQLAINLQTVISRDTDPADPAVLSIGKIQGGDSFNVIAEKCSLIGTVRTFNETLRDHIADRIQSISEHTCAMNGASCQVAYKKGYPPLVNDEAETGRFFRVAHSLFGEDYVHRPPLMMPGEDFAYYLQQVPGCFMLVGAGNPERGIHYPHHHPRFDIEERAMVNSAVLLCEMAMDFLRKK